MQDMDEQEANAKLVLETINPFQTKCKLTFHQTKCTQDMDEQEANAKLVLGIIAFPNQT
jgi:hypothetical protein